MYHDAKIPDDPPDSSLEASIISMRANYDPSEDPEIREIISDVPRIANPSRWAVQNGK